MMALVLTPARQLWSLDQKTMPSSPCCSACHLRHPHTREFVSWRATVWCGRRCCWRSRHSMSPPGVKCTAANAHLPGLKAPWRPSSVDRPITTAPMLAPGDRSVRAQTCQDFEIVVVDDGSQDDPRSVAERLWDSRIDFLQPNGGGSRARIRPWTMRAGRHRTADPTMSSAAHLAA